MFDEVSNVRFKLGDWERDAMCVTVADCEKVFNTVDIDLMAKAFSTKDKAALIRNLLLFRRAWFELVKIVFPEFTQEEFNSVDVKSVGEFLVNLQLYCIGCMTGIENPNPNSKPVKKK